MIKLRRSGKRNESKSVRCESVRRDGVIRGFLTNLGKYNEGELVGRWVDFPLSEKEFRKALKEIGIGDKNGFGATYEETFWTDWETSLDGFDAAGHFGEYASYEDVNAIAEALEEIDDDASDMLETLNFTHSDIECNIANIINGNVWSYDDVDSWEDLADREIDDAGGVESLDKETQDRYFDFEQFGRDLRMEFHESDVWDEDEIKELEEQDIEPNAGYYYCHDDNASDREIGEAFVDDFGMDSVSNPDYYFDYKSFGRDMQYDGNWVIDKVAVFTGDYDPDLKLDDVI